MHLQSTVTLVGNLVDDVSCRQAGGSTVATFRLACSNGYRDRRTERWVETTTYLRVSAWRQLAENAVASLAKGQPVVVVGRPRQREYETDGRRVTVVDVEADFIGHDLTRGVAEFRRNARGPQTADLTQPPDLGRGAAVPSTPGDERHRQPAAALVTEADPGQPSDSASAADSEVVAEPAA